MRKEAKRMEHLRQKTHDGVDALMDKAQDMQDSGKEKMIHAKERAIVIGKNMDSYIHKKPKKMIVLAAGIGAVIGAIITASLMSRKE